jgi:hypothetical protein
MTYKTEYAKYLQIFNEQLDLAIKCFSSDVPEELKDAMIYSVDGGGKRNPRPWGRGRNHVVTKSCPGGAGRYPHCAWT